MIAQGITDAKTRQSVRLALIRLAQRIAEQPCEVDVKWERGSRQVKPAPGDEYFRYEYDGNEKWEITTKWADK